MKTINRNEIEVDIFKKIIDTETHHEHEIIEVDGVLRWKPNKNTNEFLKNISLNDLCQLLTCLGYGKNSEVYRKLYRDMGYSLFGYWEIFYWEVNNKNAPDYIPNAL